MTRPAFALVALSRLIDWRCACQKVNLPTNPYFRLEI